mgnify:CR=1 FL=1
MSEYREGQTATNPKTGQKVMFKGGQWVNASPPSPSGMFGRKPTAAEISAQTVAKSKGLGADAVERQLGVLESLYNKNFKGVGPGSLLEYLPTQARRQFDAAADGMRPLLKPLVRDPGEGTFSDADQALLDQMIPDGGRQDADNEQRIANIRAMISDARKKSSAFAAPGSAGQISRTIRKVR